MEKNYIKKISFNPKVKRIKEYILITFGALVVSLAVQLFFVPAKIAPGGVSGIGIVLNSLFPEISVSGFIIGINIILFIIAFKFLGDEFGFKSLYASFILSGFMWIIENKLTIERITEDYMLSAIIGGVLLGVGLSIVFNQKSSTGGTDIIASIINKYTYLSLGYSMIIIDFIVVFSGMLLFGLERGLYGAISTLLIGSTINKVVEGFNVQKEVVVITKEKDKVKKYIINTIERGVTIFSAEGGYSENKKYALYSVVSSKEFITLKIYLKENIPDAFITVGNVNEVFGEGFSRPKNS